MKSCKNCMLNNTCADYYAKNCNSQVCEWYTENQDEKISKIINQSDFGYSDAQIHGEDNKTQKKYKVDICHDNGGLSTFRNVIKIKFIDLNAVSLLNIVTEDNCRYTYNLAMGISFRVTEEEKENGSNL